MKDGRSSIRYELAVGVLICAFGIFAAARAQHEYRWSGWGPGEAQTLNAVRHFQQEGFRTHYFLPYFHPGYLGQVVGTASYLGYYTHYPPLSVLFNGLVAMLASDSLFAFRLASIVVSMGALVCWYLTAGILFGRRVALLSTLFIATSVAFLEYADSVSIVPLDEFLRFAVILLFLIADQTPADSRRRVALLVATWIAVFLQSFNSFDYIIFLQVFFWGYYLLKTGPRALPYRKLFLLATAPVVGFLLHVGQNAAALGIGEAYRDLAGIFWKRTLDVRAIESPWDLLRTVWGDFRINFPHLNAYFSSGFGMDLVAVLLLAAVVLLFLSWSPRDLGSDAIHWPISPARALLLLAVSGVTFWVFMMGRIFPYMHLHALPVVASLFGLTVTLSWARLRDTTSGLTRWAGAIALLACVLPALDRLSYFREYPNLLDPKRVWLMEVPRDEMIEGLEISKRVKEKTSYGDIVMVPFRGLWDGGREVNPLYEYYSERRNEPLGRNVREFEERRASLDAYRAKLASDRGVSVKLFALVRAHDQADTERSLLYRHLLARDHAEPLAGNWKLVHLGQRAVDRVDQQ